MFLIALEGVFAPAALYDKSSASFRCQPVVAEIERFSYFFTFCCHGGVVVYCLLCAQDGNLSREKMICCWGFG